MNQRERYLTTHFINDEITSIVEDAMGEKYTLTFIEDFTGAERKLAVPELAAIRSSGVEKKVVIKLPSLPESIVAPIPGHNYPIWRDDQKYVNHLTQEVGYRDLRADEVTLAQIKKEHPYFGSKIKHQTKKGKTKNAKTQGQLDNPNSSSGMGKKGAGITNAIHYETEKKAIKFTGEYCKTNSSARKNEVARKFKEHSKCSHAITTIEGWIKDCVPNKKPGRPPKVKQT